MSQTSDRTVMKIKNAYKRDNMMTLYAWELTSVCRPCKCHFYEWRRAGTDIAGLWVDEGDDQAPMEHPFMLGFLGRCFIVGNTGNSMEETISQWRTHVAIDLRPCHQLLRGRLNFSLTCLSVCWNYLLRLRCERTRNLRTAVHRYISNR